MAGVEGSFTEEGGLSWVPQVWPGQVEKSGRASARGGNIVFTAAGKCRFNEEQKNPMSVKT